jgi:hypothetical protein
MNENPTAISEPDFEEEFLEDVKELFYLQFEDDILENDWVEDDLDDLLEEAFKIFIGTFYPERSISNNIILTDNDPQNDSDKDNEENENKNEIKGAFTRCKANSIRSFYASLGNVCNIFVCSNQNLEKS